MGNIVSFINNEKFNFIKNIKIFYFNILRYLFYIKITNYFPVIYKGYIGILNRFIINKIYINRVEVSSICLNSTLKIIRQLSKIFSSTIKSEILGKKYVFLRLEISNSDINNKDFNLLLNKTLKLIKKKEIVLIKLHPHDINNYKTINIIKTFLKKNKIKVLIIDDVFLSKIPAEIFISVLGIKKIISVASALPLYSSCLFKDIKIFMFLDYSLKYPIANLQELNVKNKFVYKVFKKIKFI